MRLASRLHLNKLIIRCHHKICVNFRRAIFVIIKIKNRYALKYTAGNGGNLSGQRRFGDGTGQQQFFAGNAQRHPGAGDRCCAGAAISLYHIAVNFDLAFAKRLKIGNSPQRPANQPLNFKRSARLFATRGFTIHPAMCRARQHAIFSGDPALAAIAQKWWHPLVK